MLSSNPAAFTWPIRSLFSALVEVAPDVACLPLSLVNLYFYGVPYAGAGSWAVIDTGTPGSAGRVLRAAAERFGPNTRPAAIILTHGHFDHASSARDLADRWDVPVYAHELEIPYLTGQSDYPPQNPIVGGALAFLSRFFPHKSINLRGRVHVLPADGRVPGMPGWRWLHTPGHTPGHVSLFRAADRVLLAGDAFATMNQDSMLGLVTKRRQVRRPPATFTPDWPAARRSVMTLARLQPNVAAAGHGRPMYGESLRQGLEALLRAWDRVALPAR